MSNYSGSPAAKTRLPFYQTQAQALLLLRQRQAANPQSLNKYLQYQHDPVGFCEHYFGETFTDDVKSVMESVRDNPVTIARSGNAVGKTHAAARLAIWFYKVFPGAQVYTTSAPPERNLRKLLWGEIGHVIHEHHELFTDDKIGADMNIQRDSLSFLTGVSIPSQGTPEQREAKFSGKHAPFIFFIIDEGDAVPHEVYQGIESCMSGGMARLLVMFNPRTESGHVANMERSGEGKVVSLSAINHPNVVSGTDVIPGAVTREKTVQRINKWSRPLAGNETHDLECFDVPDFLIGAIAPDGRGGIFPPLPTGWRKATEPSFFYMVLGQYPPQSEMQLISRTWIDAAISRWMTYVATYGERPTTYLNPLAGLDVAEYGKDKNQLCFRYGGWVPHLQGWSGLDPDTTAIKTAGIIQDLKYHFQVFVDATGVGAGVPARLVRLGVTATGIKVGSSPSVGAYDDSQEKMGDFAALRDQLWWSVREWLRKDTGAMLPPDDDLSQELAVPMYGIVGGKIKVTSKDTMREMLGRSPDKADALCLTFAQSEIGQTFAMRYA
jgi:hypothetical protein